MSTVTIDGPAVYGLARNQAVVAEFPFLAKYARPATPGCCGQSTRPSTAPALKSIASLPPQRVKVLKSILGVDTIVVWVVRAARKTRVTL